jgi:hypothetical protein
MRPEEEMNLDPIDVQRNLKGMSYPAGRDDLAATAERNGADDDLIQALRALPDSEYDGPDDVMERLGQAR